MKPLFYFMLGIFYRILFLFTFIPALFGFYRFFVEVWIEILICDEESF